MLDNFINTLVYIFSILIYSSIMINKPVIFKPIKILFTFPFLILSVYILDNDFLIHVTLFYFVYSTIIIKLFLDISLKKALTIFTLFFINLCFFDIVLSIVFMLLSSFDNYKIKYTILINITLFFLSISPIFFKRVRLFLLTIIEWIDGISSKLIAYILSLIFATLILFFLVSINIRIEYLLLMLLVFISFVFLFFSLLKEWQEKYLIINKYNELDDYINSFESVLDKQNMLIHEYKNQLYIIRGMSKKKDSNLYIDSLLKDSFDTDNLNIKELNKLSKNGLRSLLYYKITRAIKEEIDISLVVSTGIRKDLDQIELIKQKYLLNFVGVFLDNAIEAAKDTSDKKILIEIYKIKGKITIVISNSIVGEIDLNLIETKGFSTKGNDRGMGLYLAKKLNDEKEYFDIESEVVENYFIIKLTIKD